MSMIHSAASRTHNRNAFFQLLQELDVNIGLRNEHYKTPRDIAVGSNIWENVKTIDKYVVHIIARGKFTEIIDLSIEYIYIRSLRHNQRFIQKPVLLRVYHVIRSFNVKRRLYISLE